MQNISRRGFFKFLTLSAGTTLLAQASESKPHQSEATKTELLPKNSKQTRVVVVGGGIGGLTVAQHIKSNDPKDQIEVIVLEKNSHYFACPMSNTLFGEIKEVEDEKIPFLYDYVLAEKNHDIDVIITEVIDAEISKKRITTTSGTIEYDYVVVAPGIDYNYKKLFPTWSQEKIRRATKETPAAMFADSGKEKHILLDQLKAWKEAGGKGYFVIVPPKSGKVRCKPASYERACMVSEYIKKYKLPGKVYILDNAPVPKAKGPVFLDIFMKKHKDIIVFNGMSGDEMINRIKKVGLTMTNFKKKENFSKVEEAFATCDITDVDFDKKEISFQYAENFDDDDGRKETLNYAIANIIPHHRGNRTAELFDVKKDGWGGIVCAPYKIYSVSDSSVYVAGDIIGYHKFDPSAQASASVGILTGESLAKRILTGTDEIDFTKAGITCFSMVSTDPLTAIEIAKDTIVTEEGLAKAGSSTLKIRDGAGLIGWYQAMVETPFKY